MDARQGLKLNSQRREIFETHRSATTKSIPARASSDLRFPEVISTTFQVPKRSSQKRSTNWRFSLLRSSEKGGVTQVWDEDPRYSTQGIQGNHALPVQRSQKVRCKKYSKKWHQTVCFKKKVVPICLRFSAEFVNLCHQTKSEKSSAR